VTHTHIARVIYTCSMQQCLTDATNRVYTALIEPYDAHTHIACVIQIGLARTIYMHRI